MIERHHGKAMIAIEEDGITITQECGECGRKVIGPIPLAHLRVILSMLEETADSLGIPKDTYKHESVARRIGAADDEIANIKAEFEAMPLDGGVAQDKRSAWDE